MIVGVNVNHLQHKLLLCCFHQLYCSVTEM